jgi:hypothetical protein
MHAAGQESELSCRSGETPARGVAPSAVWSPAPSVCWAHGRRRPRRKRSAHPARSARTASARRRSPMGPPVRVAPVMVGTASPRHRHQLRPATMGSRMAARPTSTAAAAAPGVLGVRAARRRTTAPVRFVVAGRARPVPRRGHRVATTPMGHVAAARRRAARPSSARRALG